MAPRKKNDSQSKRGPVNPNAVIENAGVMVEQPITETLEKNYMPYAMSVILSRAIPEIDGFKPSHRKLLYTMYKMGLLTSARTKSANVVGQTMPVSYTHLRRSQGRSLPGLSGYLIFCSGCSAIRLNYAHRAKE